MIRPLGERVVLMPIEAPTTTSGGVYLPESHTERPQIGEVLAVGPGEYDSNGNLKPMHVEVGQRVLFGKYDITEVDLDGEDLYIIGESKLLGVLP